MPPAIAAEIAGYGVSPSLLKRPAAGIEMAHLFVTRRADLAKQLALIEPLLSPNGTIWISWPKKSSGVITDITEDSIRAEAFPRDLVDIKVCAVDDIWSGLKLVIRKENRAQRAKA